MPSIKKPIFIIGYPKSGSTWLARLVADVLDSPIVTGNDIVNQADKKQTYSGPFEIHKGHYSRKNKPEYITQQSKIFYVVRDFRDVLISGYFFNHQSHNEKRVAFTRKRNLVNLLFRIYFEHQVRRMIKRWTSHELTILRNLLKRNKNFVGSWSEHVNFWLAFPNAYMVRYEDMLTDTLFTTRLAFNSLGLPFNDRRLEDAIERQSFNKRKRKFEAESDVVNARFLRRGVEGDWNRFLDEKALKIIRCMHGSTMLRLGYEI